MSAEPFDEFNRRTRDRAMVDVFVPCRVPAVPVRAILKDLSRTGCRIAFDGEMPEPGSSVTIELGDGQSMVGEVVWQAGKEVGVRFRRNLSTANAVRYGLEAPASEQVASQPVEAETSPANFWIQRITRRLRG